MTSDFWAGFEEKQASLLDAAKAGMKAAPKAIGAIEHAVEGGTHRVLDYSKMKGPTASSLPIWKQKMMAAGKKPVGVATEQMQKAAPAATHAPAQSAFEAGEAELARRRQSLQKGSTPMSAYGNSLARN